MSPRAGASVAADGQTQPRAPVLAAGVPVDLLERLEDDLCLASGNSDAPCRSPRRRPPWRPIELAMALLQPDVAGEIRQGNGPWSVNLKSVRQQILQYHAALAFFVV